MHTELEDLQKKLCSSLCAEIIISAKRKDLLVINTPFHFPDGDPYQIYIKLLPSGALRMTDCGHTLMRLSYENDIDKFREGTRGRVFQSIIDEMDLLEDYGEFYLDSQPDKIGEDIFRFGQAITKIHDITFLNKVRVESTFYDDLYSMITGTVSEKIVTKDFTYKEMENYNDYPIDYKIEGKSSPLFLFGIPSKDKARLSTIVLERLLRSNADFESLIVFSNQSDLPRSDLARLTNVGGEMVASLDSKDDFQRKLLRRAAH